MKQLHLSALCALIVASASTPAFAAASAPPKFSTTTLRPYVDWYYTRPAQLNNRGDYMLEFISDSPNNAGSNYIIDAGGTEKASMAYMWKMNDLGQVAGATATTIAPYEFNYAPVFWNGTSTSTISRDGIPFWGNNINNRGQLAGGFSSPATAPGTAQINFIFDTNTGSFTQLGSFGGKTDIRSINDAGVAVGSSETTDGTRHAFVYENGTMTDLGTFGGTSSSAISINSRGDILVAFAGVDPQQQSYGLLRDGILTDLTAAVGGGWVLELNDLGQVLIERGYVEWYLWQDGDTYNLEDLLETPDGFPHLRRVASMNDKGELLGMSCLYEMECAIVKWSPIAVVPEPSTWAMLAGGLLVLVPALRRRSRKIGQYIV